MRGWLISALLLWCAASPSVLAQSEEPLQSPPPIRKGVPEGAFLYLHILPGAGIDFWESNYGCYLRAFKSSGLMDEIWKVIQEAASEDSAEEIVASWKTVGIPFFSDKSIHEPFRIIRKILDRDDEEESRRFRSRIDGILQTVDWKALIADECVFAMEHDFDGPVYTLISRMPAETASVDYSKLTELFRVLAEASGDLELQEWGLGPAKGVTVVFDHPDIVHHPTLALAGDVLFLSNKRRSVQTAVQLVFGIRGGTEEMESAIDRLPVPLVDTEGFREIFEQLPAATHGRFFLKPLEMFLAYNALEETDPIIFRIDGEDALSGDQFARFAADMIHIVDRLAWVSYEESGRLVEEQRVVFPEQWRQNPMMALHADMAPVKGFQRFVPRDAISFQVASEVNYGGLHDLIFDVLERFAPRWTESVKAHWSALQEAAGFHLKEDLLDLIGGTSASVTFPGRGKRGAEEAFQVYLLELRDPARAGALLNRFTDLMNAWLGKVSRDEAIRPEADPVVRLYLNMLKSYRITIKPLEREGVSPGWAFHSPFLSQLRHAYGIYGDYFFLASSEGALAAYLDFFEKGEPSILENEAFLSLNLEPPDLVHKISFENLQQRRPSIWGTLAAVCNGTTMFLPADPSAEEARTALKWIGKLSRFMTEATAAKRDRKWEAFYEILDWEKGRFHTREVNAY